MFSFAQMTDTQVAQDLIEPGKELALGIECVPVLIRPGKGLLRQFQSIFVIAYQAQGKKVRLFHVRLNKGLKGLFGFIHQRPLARHCLVTCTCQKRRAPLPHNQTGPFRGTDDGIDAYLWKLFTPWGAK